tara:strand:+ start:22 stop:381 length:360 start_codon:yes stop_codon:yes gene_type:complete
MDERLEKALEFSNYMLTLNNQKRLLTEKYQEELLYFYNGCQFTVTKELINFVKLLLDSHQDTNAVLTDDNGIPTIVEDVDKFYDSIIDVYFVASNSYHSDYMKLKKQRSVEKLVDYEEN